MSTHINMFKDARDIHINYEKIRDIGLNYFDLSSRVKKIKFVHDKKLKDKVVVITGASSGIGKASAIEFARQGARLVLAARNIEALNETARITNSLGAESVVVPTDVTKEEQCKILIEKAVNEFGGIDIFVSNAGLSMRALFSELDLTVLKKLMDVNFWGLVYCIKYALPYLQQSKGSLLAVSSMASYVPLPARTGYCASKSAVNGFINTLRMEEKNQGVHIMLVSPGFTASNIRKTALNKYGEPQQESPVNENSLMRAEDVAKRMVKATQNRERSLILTFQAKMAYFVNKFNPAMVEYFVLKKLSKENNSPK